MPFKNWVAGDRVYAADVMSFLMNQAVIVCANAAARPASPVKGMTVYQSDVDQLQAWNGSAWVRLPSAGSIVNADINASAAIAYSKLNLASSIVNADVNASAAIAWSKLGGLPTVKLSRTASYQVFSGEQDIVWDTETNDTHNYYPGTGAIITVPTGYSGIHAITATVDMTAGISANGYIKLIVNGFIHTAYQTTGNDKCSVSATVNIAAGQTIKVTGYNPSSGSQRGWIEVTRVGAAS